MKWKVEVYSCFLDDEEINIYYEGGDPEKLWRLEGDKAWGEFPTLKEAKKEVKEKYGKDLKFAPSVWVLEVSIGSETIYVEIERTKEGAFAVEIDAPYVEVGNMALVTMPTLAAAKRGCEALVEGVLCFLEARGWKRGENKRG